MSRSRTAREDIQSIVALVGIHQVVREQATNLGQHGRPNLCKRIHLDSCQTHLFALHMIALRALFNHNGEKKEYKND
jgi:hypothetical protein